MLLTDYGSVRIVVNCDRGLKNTARGRTDLPARKKHISH